MKLSYSSNAYRRYSIEETIARIAALGYQGLELLADVPHAWPVDMLPAHKESILQSLKTHNLQIANVNAFMMNAVADCRQTFIHPSWIEPYPHYRAIRREHTIRSLKLAAELGAPSIQTEPGGPLPEGMSRDEALTIFYDELMPCVEVAEQTGVSLLIEPEPALLIEKFEQYLEFVDRIDSPAVGLNFDIGHAYCVGDDPAEWVPRLADHTRHYHLEDIAATREHFHLIPGHGAIDLQSALDAIGQTDYDGWVTVELYANADDPDAAGREALEVVQSMI